MLRLALIVAVFVGANTVSAAAQQLDDARAIAFRNDCASTLTDIVVTKRHIEAASWVKVAASVDPELQALYNWTRSSEIQRTLATIEVYSRAMSGRRIYMMITENARADGTRLNGCYVYDLAADAFAADPDAGQVIERWLGEPPSEAFSTPSTMSNKVWLAPSSHPEVATIQVSSVPAGSEIAGTLKFTGRVWAATAEAN